jgi:GNAT superfamily N-acetyltransferase
MTLHDISEVGDSLIETGRGLRIRPLTPADMPAVSEMTARCSKNSIYHRFHGFIDLPTYLRNLLAGQQRSVLAWCGSSCVGLASLGTSLRGQELAVLVEDAWQRKGVGVAMFEVLADLVKTQELGLLHADVLFEDAFILGVLARYGKLQVELESGDYSVSVHLDDEHRARREALGARTSTMDVERRGQANDRREHGPSRRNGRQRMNRSRI